MLIAPFFPGEAEDWIVQRKEDVRRSKSEKQSRREPIKRRLPLKLL